MFPKRMSAFVAVLAVLVIAGVLGLGEYEATAADILLWVLCALLIVALARAVWRRVATRGR